MKNISKVFLVLLSISSFVTNCDSDNLKVEIVASRISDSQIVLRVENRGLITAYLSNCTASRFVKILYVKIDNEWQQSNNWPCLDIYGPSGLALELGEVQADTLTNMQLSGTYRFEVAISKDRGGSPEFHNSNIFEE